MTSPRTLLRAAVVAALFMATPAVAEPPEGCVGVPSVPAAYACVTEWSPENAVPDVRPGPGQTVEIPEVCAFQCFGPTPVTVPDVDVTPGHGAVVAVSHNGSTYAVGGPSGSFSAVANVPCYGCGDSVATLTGTFSGTLNGVAYDNASMSANYVSNASTGPDCLLTSHAAGYMRIGPNDLNFTWTHVADTVSITFTAGISGSGEGVFRVLTGGVTCGGPATIQITGTITQA